VKALALTFWVLAGSAAAGEAEIATARGAVEKAQREVNRLEIELLGARAKLIDAESRLREAVEGPPPKADPLEKEHHPKPATSATKPG